MRHSLLWLENRPIDLRKLKVLIDLVSESNVAELDITEPDGRVRIVKAGATPWVMAAPVIQPVAAVPVAASLAAGCEAAQAPGHVVKSPMVGTFYRSSSPGAKAFAEAGDQVKAGQPVCMIEAMKIMNEIESDRDGQITEMLVENGQPVEYGQPLFVVA